MKLLAIDTSSTACSVALFCNNELTLKHEIAPMQQAQTILPLIDLIVREANISLKQLDALAFGAGPGSFTGVRIAVSVMQGIGYAMDLPLISVSSLAALAQAAYSDLGWKKLLVGIDARIQEVYWGAYQVNPEGLVELVGKEMVCPPEGVLLPEGSDWHGVGNAWEVYSGQLAFQPLEIDATRLPIASGIMALAKDKFKRKEWVRAEEALPVYLRDEVAKKSRK